MRRFIALLVALVLAMPLSAYAQSEPSDWAKNMVDTGAASFLQAADGEIDYAADVTREQFAIIALNIYGAVSGVEIPSMNVTNPFVDCNNPLVVAAYGIGLVNGVSDNEFAPDESITREQICTMIGRIALQAGLDESYLPELTDFSDAEDVSDWAKQSVKMCVYLNILQGNDEGKILPLDSCTVQEALIISARLKNMR